MFQRIQNEMRWQHLHVNNVVDESNQFEREDTEGPEGTVLDRERFVQVQAREDGLCCRVALQPGHQAAQDAVHDPH